MANTTKSRTKIQIPSHLRVSSRFFRGSICWIRSLGLSSPIPWTDETVKSAQLFPCGNGIENPWVSADTTTIYLWNIRTPNIPETWRLTQKERLKISDQRCEIDGELWMQHCNVFCALCFVLCSNIMALSMIFAHLQPRLPVDGHTDKTGTSWQVNSSSLCLKTYLHQTLSHGYIRRSPRCQSQNM